MGEGRSILGRSATAAAADICVGLGSLGSHGMTPQEKKLRMGEYGKARMRIKEDR